MAYGFETDAFSQLSGRLRDYPDPDGIPLDRETISELAELYIAAARALFHLMLLIMNAHLERSEDGHRFQGFLEIYQSRVSALIAEINQYFIENINNVNISEIYDFIEGVRQSALANELEALQHAVSESPDTDDAIKSDAEATETVTNSLKEQIERRIKRRWIKDILHSINEVISIIRGVQ